MCNPALIGNAEAQVSCANDPLEKRQRLIIKIIFFICLDIYLFIYLLIFIMDMEIMS
jgi:hypothetical protein